MTDRETVNTLADRAIALYRGKKDPAKATGWMPMTEAVWVTLRRRWPKDRAGQRRYFNAVMARITELSQEKKISEARRAPDAPKPESKPIKKRAEQLELPGTETEHYMGHPDVPLGPRKR